MLKEIIL